MSKARSSNQAPPVDSSTTGAAAGPSPGAAATAAPEAVASSGAAIQTASTSDQANDSLVGDAGNDSLVGDAGNDSLIGDAGNDLISTGDGFHDALARTLEGAEFLGSKLLPEVVDLGFEQISGDQLARHGAAIAGLTRLEWNELPEGIRDEILGKVLAFAKTTADHVGDVRNLVSSVVDQELQAITARSKDGQTYRRAGHVFGDAFATIHATAEAAKEILEDPWIQLKPIAATEGGNS